MAEKYREALTKVEHRFLMQKEPRFDWLERIRDVLSFEVLSVACTDGKTFGEKASTAIAWNKEFVDF